MVSPVSIAFYPLGFEVGKREGQRSIVRESATESKEEKQGPAAGNIWILNNTAEQNTHLGIEDGERSWISGYVI